MPLDASLAQCAVRTAHTPTSDAAMTDALTVLRPAKLTQATVKIHRILDLDRIGYLHDRMLGELSALLTEAGQPELAARVDVIAADGFGGDLRPIETAARELLTKPNVTKATGD